MKITFDPAKRKATLENRGLNMALAGVIFAGPPLTVPSDREGEHRFFTIGLLNGGWSWSYGRREMAVVGSFP